MGGVALDIKGLSIGYTGKSGSTVVADGIDATLLKGELVALIGRNGAGKSTTLKTISGIMRPKTGSIDFQGQDITRVLAHKIVAEGCWDTDP